MTANQKEKENLDTNKRANRNAGKTENDIENKILKVKSVV
jgi:hypothetical protein